MDNRENLAAYQSRLLDLLYQLDSAEEICRSIEPLEDANAAKKDRRMVDVAAILVKKWAVPIRRTP